MFSSLDLEFAMMGEENEVIWLDDPARFVYVRCYTWFSELRDDSPDEYESGRLIGYTTLKADAWPHGPEDTFAKRMFVLEPWDCDYQGSDKEDGPYSTSFYPNTAVDPLTIGPGIKGFQVIQ